VRRRAALALLAGAIAGAVAASIYYTSLGSVGDAEARVTAILADHGGRDTGLPLPQRAAGAVVAVEDERFYHHGALDLIAMGRALLDKLTLHGGDPGGSTIALQLARELYGHGRTAISALPPEIAYALKLEAHYSKRRILEIYLNATYFGNGFWGIAQASEGYFHTPPRRLDWAEASMLAGLPAGPTLYDPLRRYALARDRQREVLDRLVDDGALTSARATRIDAERLPGPVGRAATGIRHGLPPA
jgi:membrane peptidoglycan carboxypeptidase